jgi:hypothetical protein
MERAFNVFLGLKAYLIPENGKRGKKLESMDSHSPKWPQNFSSTLLYPSMACIAFHGKTKPNLSAINKSIDNFLLN